MKLGGKTAQDLLWKNLLEQREETLSLGPIENGLILSQQFRLVPAGRRQRLFVQQGR